MQTENNFFQEIKHQYTYGGMTIKLIFINLIVFLFISILEVFSRLIGSSVSVVLSAITENAFVLKTDYWALLTHPWTLFTSIFAHYDFWHFLWNMVFLYFSGKMFEQFFDQKRMFYTYLLGGIFGGLFEILANVIFPNYTSGAVIGASGSVMAILISLAFHKPQLQVALFGIFNLRLIFFALFFILKDLLSLGMNDGVAHFAHLGGIVLGMLSIKNLYSSSNIINSSQRIGDKIVHFIRIIFKPSRAPKMKVNKGGNSRSQQFKSDEQFNLEKKERQQKTDIILDKISKSGYESLTKEEKDFLFRQSNNG